VIRVHVGGRLKHLRLLAEIARDVDGHPVKAYTVVQDITGREESRTAMLQLTDELGRRERSLVAEHRIAAQLQHIILPLPGDAFDLDRLRVAVRYLPAERTSQIGGDWYLTAIDDDGGAICGVGDVAGHGLTAATAMAQLRYAIIGWITIGITDPGRLMHSLNQLCIRLNTTATAIITRFDPDTRSLTWAQAGHPPPLHTRAGTTTELERPDGMLLGALPSAAYATTTMRFTPGDLLLLYTDGLIERRGHDPEENLISVKETLAAISRSGHGQPLAELTAVLHYANPDDDTCLLGMRPLI
jgi:serine phosphatase RsbU (regulator of sigma subunit)